MIFSSNEKKMAFHEEKKKKKAERERELGPSLFNGILEKSTEQANGLKSKVASNKKVDIVKTMA